MILVFGGTTEGRQAVTALEEAGTTFYYSTRGDAQELNLVHGVRLTGAMDVPAITSFCQEHHIRLLVDAAHPFAEQLHVNILSAAQLIGIPVIRFDRIYPPHTDGLIYCKDYDEAIAQLETHHIDQLLALTGVQTIGRLRPYWQRHDCWFRILERTSSKLLAQQDGFPTDHLVYYEEDNTAALLQQLRPQAILTKESGVSGGFCEKTEAARKAGVKIFVVERPAYPPRTTHTQDVTTETVNGPFGLRRRVEHLLPAFFPLKSGLTTGTCATAAALAATIRLLSGRTPDPVRVTLPDGEQIPVAVGYGDHYAYCIKEAGDDPDVTNGIEVRAEVKWMKDEAPQIVILGGSGVGMFTLPGFDYPPGSPAINRVPRQMIRENLIAALPSTLPSALQVIISVSEGETIARRTFNPRLGIVGGISIIGQTGIVKPFSEEAFLQSIGKCMQVAAASGASRVVIHSGGKSERFLHTVYPDLPQQNFVEYGNYIGETLKMASHLNFSSITLGIMLGKAVKLAEGQLDTHSRKGTMNKVFIREMLTEAGCQIKIEDMTLARELWQRIPKEEIERFCTVVIRRCMSHCQPLVPHAALTLLLIDDDGTIHSL